MSKNLNGKLAIVGALSLMVGLAGCASSGDANVPDTSAASVTVPEGCNKAPTFISVTQDQIAEIIASEQFLTLESEMNKVNSFRECFDPSFVSDTQAVYDWYEENYSGLGSELIVSAEAKKLFQEWLANWG